ncbi:MAG: ABC transporter ATP-binding protein [Trueperaceae bacterium]
MSASPLLEVDGLTISLNMEAGLVALVDDVKFAIEPGDVVALVGESGSGKSVTAQALLGLLPNNLAIHRGAIRFHSERLGATVDLAQVPADGPVMRRIRGNDIAMIFQEPMSSFSPVHTIGDHIVEVLRAHSAMSRKEMRTRAIEMLDRVQIADPARAVDRYPHEFSGGMRQRAMIAKALACNPALLVADEPTTALDVTIQAQILELLREIQLEFGMAVLFITHDLGVVAQIADQVAVMYTGKLVEQGPKKEVFKAPRHPYTRELLAATPRIEELAGTGELKSIRGNVPGLFDLPTGCTFHPRCDSFMVGKCDSRFPGEIELEAGHRVSCFLYD